MMFYSVTVFCLLIIGLHGNATTELNMNDNLTESSVNLLNTTMSTIDILTESSVNLLNTTMSTIDILTESSVNLLNTTMSTIDNLTESSVNLFNTTMSIIDNFRGVYVITRGIGRAYTAPVVTTTANVTILGNISVPIENSTRFTCGKYNPCHWQFYNVYNHERKFEMEYPSVCDCPNNTVCRYYRDNISIRAFEFRCMEVNLSSAEPETSSASEASPADSV